MPKRGKEPRSSSRHSGGRYSPPPLPSSRQPRNDYQIAGPSRTMNVINSPIVLTDDDDDNDYKNVDTSMNTFRENGNKMKPDSGECTRIVKHFVPSADRYQMSQCATDKPRFRGPETDVLHDLEKDKLKNIRVQMIRADVQQNDSFRKAYVIEESASSRSKGEKNHQNFDDRQAHFNPTQQMHYDNGTDKNYGMVHSVSPNQMMSRDRSLSPRINMGRPPSPPLPYSPERDHFNSDMLRRDRAKRSSERNIYERQQRPEHFSEQHKIESFSSGPPPEPRSPETQRFRSGDPNRHRMKEDQSHYEDRPPRRSRSPVYFGNHYPYRRSMSPNIRPFSPPHRGQMPMSPPPSRELSSPSLRDRLSHPSDRPRRRRSPPSRRDRSRERRRRLSPRRRTPPPVRSPIKRRENSNGKKRGSNKSQDARKREAKEKKRRSGSKSKSAPQQEQQQIAFQPQPQPMYPPPPGVVRLPPPPRPFPPGPMMIPLRPPPFPPPMGGWRPGRPPMQAPPPSGWPYPRPRPFYFPY